jgi:hypothetical protein
MTASDDLGRMSNQEPRSMPYRDRAWFRLEEQMPGTTTSEDQTPAPRISAPALARAHALATAAALLAYVWLLFAALTPIDVVAVLFALGLTGYLLYAHRQKVRGFVECASARPALRAWGFWPAADLPC